MDLSALEAMAEGSSDAQAAIARIVENAKAAEDMAMLQQWIEMRTSINDSVQSMGNIAEFLENKQRTALEMRQYDRISNAAEAAAAAAELGGGGGGGRGRGGGRGGGGGW